MILNNVRVADTDKDICIRISEGRIAQISDTPLTGKDTQQFVFFNAIVFPGLINSHDHLDFNLFAQLGDRIYHNYTEWGEYIHKTYPAEIAATLKIPVELRERWGVFKNLLCGVTTVVNHGDHTRLNNPLITVYEKAQSLHSVKFEKEWKTRLNNPLKINKPVAIHVGEGTNAAAKHEIDELIHWNLLHRTLIGIHGVALTPTQAKAFKALVWCPQSNYFLLNATAPVNHLKKFTQILFGTDSTLTGSWNIWDHIGMARKTQLLTDAELYQSLTGKAAETWQLNCGSIQQGLDADLVIAKAKTNAPGLSSFYDTQPDDILLVIHKGQIRLFDQVLYHQLTDVPLSSFSKMHVGNSIKYVQGDMPGLINQIKEYKPDAGFPVYIHSEPAA